jgi:hypothetical protein
MSERSIVLTPTQLGVLWPIPGLTTALLNLRLALMFNQSLGQELEIFIWQVVDPLGFDIRMGRSACIVLLGIVLTVALSHILLTLFVAFVAFN